MRTFKVLLVFFLLAPLKAYGLELPSEVQSGAGNPASSRRQDFFLILLQALSSLDPRYVTEFALNREEDVERLTEEIRQSDRIVTRLCSVDCECETATRARDVLPRFEQQVLPALYRFQLHYGLNPSEEVLRRFYNGNLAHYPQQESVFAAEIVVSRSGTGEPDETSATLERIASRLRAGEDFFRVAHDYYTSAGQQASGNLGRITPADLPDWKFELFARADPKEPFFGPVETPQGFLFGMARDRITSGPDGLYPSYRHQVLIDYQREIGKHRLKKLYASQTEALRPQTFRFDPGSSAALHQTAYTVAGTSVTFAECHARMPHLYGNPQEARYWESVARQCLENELILRSPEAGAIRASQAYKYLREAYLNTLLIQNCIERKVEAAGDDEQMLRAYYESAKENYRSSDEVTLRIIQFPYSTAEPREKGEVSAARQKDLEKVRDVRRVYERNRTTATLSSLKERHPRLRDRILASVPVDSLGRVLEMGIQNLPTGVVSPVLVEDDGYLIAEILERKAGTVAPFEEVRERVRAAWYEKERQRIRQKLADVALEF